MNNEVFLWLLLVVLLILILLYLLWAKIRHWPPFPPAYPPKEFYIQDDLVVSGPTKLLDTVPNIATSNSVAISLLDNMEFSRLNLPPNSQDLNHYSIRLYRVQGGQKNLLKTIQALEAQSKTAGTAFYAEFNRIAGSPWQPEPSPWQPEPSPWQPEPSHVSNSSASGTSTASTPIIPITGAEFSLQWAFEKIGLLPYAVEPSVKHGEGVKLAIFDTSPFDLSDYTQSYSAKIDMPAPSNILNLSLRQVEELSHLEGGSEPTEFGSTHGLFVAGMAHALAPKSNIRLVRVLDDNRRSSMYRVMRGIFDFLVELAAQAGSIPTKAVINLSLGVRLPPPGELTLPDPTLNDILHNRVDAFNHLMQAAGIVGAVVVAAAGNDSADVNPREQMHYPAILSIGMPGSLNTPGIPGTPPTPPMEHVLGVSACTKQSTIACFSNKGSIAAPGGNGKALPFVIPGIVGLVERILPQLVNLMRPAKLRRTAVMGKPATSLSSIPGGTLHLANIRCSPATHDCPTTNCEYAVIGPVLRKQALNSQVTYQPEFRFWVGTSFAAPQVAGLAAIYCSTCLGAEQAVAEIETHVITPPGDTNNTNDPTLLGLGHGIIHLPVVGATHASPSTQEMNQQPTQPQRPDRKG